MANTKTKFKATSALTTQQILQDHLLKSVKYKSLQREEYFISPSVTIEDELKLDGLDFLSKWLVGETSAGNNSPLGLISADGGIGKTTLARELCETVKSKYLRVLPLLIESDQWKNIANTGFTLDTLWDIAIARRLENGNALRSNHAALRVLMQEGLLVVIFDGFDELAAMSGDKQRPHELIAELHQLFTPEDEDVRARVILTSRTTYWKSIKHSIEEKNEIQTFSLKGFDNDQRKAYFSARLSDPVEKDLALRLAREVSGSIYGITQGTGNNSLEPQNQDRLSGTPFILNLIAHYVKGGNGQELSPFQTDPLEPLLLGVCRREKIRQDLRLTDAAQMAILEEIFRIPENEISPTEVDLILEMHNVVDPDERLRFSHHFLLTRTASGQLTARFEVLRVYFVARFLSKGLQKLYANTPEREIAQALSRNFIGQNQVVEWLAWQLRRLPKATLIRAIAHAYKIINAPENNSVQHRAAIALFKVISQVVSDGSKLERTRELREIFSQEHGSTFNGILFSGKIRSYDFSTAIFLNCKFIDVEFSASKFSHDTYFENCEFEGVLDFSNCEGIADANLSGITNSADAEVSWGKISKTRPTNKVRQEFAEEALVKALRKFKGDYGFHTIQARYKLSSTNPRNPYNSEIWNALKRHKIIEEHSISNVADGGLNICEDKEIRREIAQYLDNGIVGLSLGKVLKDLVAG